ncbi:hypothetical protein X943_001418 [Babesia divergens]|uniref:Uncharacterized protein n=1 Tax=Babesia divergens TaxID=32595 RepID=A0AAD9GFB4_BABDI|nr:hypothetical protein X943_001418 [Babesia divergens]
MMEIWERIQNNVNINLKALVIILDKFLLFSGNYTENIQDVDMLVERILSSYSKDYKSDGTVAIDDAMERIAEIKGTPQNKIKDVSQLTANIMTNVPGTVTLFLQQQSDKMLQIACEIKTECRTFKNNTLPKMQQVYDMAVVQMNRKMVSLDNTNCGNHTLEVIYKSFQEIANEVDEVIQLVESIDIYPAQKLQIQSYIQQISSFKMGGLAAYRTILNEL